MPGDVFGLAEVSYGQVEPVIAAVRRVEVDGDVRVVLREQAGQRARLGGLELRVVAVEIEVLGVRALSHAADRAELASAVPDAHPFVAVGVVDRVDEQDDVLEPAGALALGDRTQQPEARLLAFHLACVDVALDEDAGLPGGQHLLRRGAGRADHGKRHRPPFERVAVGRQVNPGRRRGHRLHEGDDLVVPAGLGVVGRFGPRQGPRALRGGRRGAATQAAAARRRLRRRRAGRDAATTPRRSAVASMIGDHSSYVSRRSDVRAWSLAE